MDHSPTDRKPSQRYLEPEDPDRRVLTPRQAAYLAETAGVPVDRLQGRALGELPELLKHRIDPILFLYRRVCGRVVKWNPVSNQYEGVPNATVHVEDTDCRFLGFFPVENPFWWLWPVSCSREDIATVRTDACGNFCVLYPRWDIDRILRLRLERVCYPDIRRPRLRDLLVEQMPHVPIGPDPGPDPDPVPFVSRERVQARLRQLVGDRAATELAAALADRRFGARTTAASEILDRPAFPAGLPAPAPQDVKRRDELAGLHALKGAGHEAIEAKQLVGPFLRCHDVLVAEWEPVFDVPDVTFRVTQDVDLDGTEETIYSEGYFDVRWNAGAIPDVILVASPSAISVPRCDGPGEARPCKDKPEIYQVGYLTVQDAAYHDPATGFAQRPNRPRPGGLSSSPHSSPAQAPYRGDLAVHACHRLPGAAFYRVLYSYEGGAEQPFLSLSWFAGNRPAFSPPPVTLFAPDAGGWYPIQPDAQLTMPDWVLEWPSASRPNGRYDLRVEVGDASKAHIAFSDPVAFFVDNDLPTFTINSFIWAGPASGTQNILGTCPVVHRKAGENGTVTVGWSVAAGHFRNVLVAAAGCGEGDPAPTGPATDYDHWHVNSGDNSVSRSSAFSVPHTLPDGVYDFVLTGYSRHFSPDDSGATIADWFIDTAWPYSQVNLLIAVVTDP